MNSPITHYMEQGSDEWFAVKLGKVSASHMSDVMAKGDGRTRKGYLKRLLKERIKGVSEKTIVTSAMQWGTDTESQAREAYKMANLVDVEQVGFIEINDYLGLSPDGLIGKNGGLEIKCPETDTHIDYILANRCPPIYIPQVQSSLWMTGREYWDFESFDPRAKERPQFIIRVERDEKKIKEIAIETELFIDELKELIKQIKGE